MAEIALQQGFGNQCVFHCQQALEKALKAIWVDRRPLGVPPRTHELPRLVRELRLPMTEADARFLQMLSEQYLPSHYPDIEAEYPEDMAASYLGRTREIYEWLLQQLN